MNKPFTGFSTDRQKTVRVPEGFFEDVVPQITSLLEMKVTLYLFWRLARGGHGHDGAGSSPRMVSLSELEGEEGLKSALSQGKGPRSLGDALREGLELAVARGTLLQMRIAGGDGGQEFEYWYLLNTRDNKAWVEALAQGQIDVAETPLVQPYMLYAGEEAIRGPRRAEAVRIGNHIRVIVERPSVYALYEQNIGLLTPILAERLQDAEGRYPLDWIQAAFEEAVTNNKRNWRYIERILERWAVEGKQSGKDRGSAERSLDPDKYTKGKYAFLFRPDR